jgi:hypothetical protein
MRTSRSGCVYGSGSNNTVLAMLNMADVAPMPSASVTMAISVKPACARSTRTA